MKELVAPNIRALAPYEPGKPEDELKRELGVDRVVKLASNENPYGPSPTVRDMLAIQDDLHRYPDPRAHDLRAALSAHHGIPPQEIIWGNGSNELIDLACRVLAEKGDHVVFGKPSFACYRIGCIAEELNFTEVPLRGGLSWNVDDLLGAVTPATKLLFLANPNNPTGAYVNGADLERLLTTLPPDVLAVIDEAYFEYVDASDYVPATALRDTRDRLLILRTFSKAHGLAALRVGYGVAKPEIVTALNRLRAPFNVGALGQRAAIAALGDPGHLAQTVAATKQDRAVLESALVALGLTVAPSQANFLLVDMGRPGRSVYEALLRKGVIVRAMGAPLEPWIRVTVGLPEENEIFLGALREVLGESGG